MVSTYFQKKVQAFFKDFFKDIFACFKARMHPDNNYAILSTLRFSESTTCNPWDTE